MKLSTTDLYRKHDQLVQLKRDAYEKLYRNCQNQIKLAANAGELVCIFEIPNILFGNGYPKINIQACAQYLRDKLAQANDNIETHFIEPNLIFIDWRR